MGNLGKEQWVEGVGSEPCEMYVRIWFWVKDNKANLSLLHL